MTSGLKHLSELSEAALSKCQRRGWKRDWVHGGSYLHLESSEFMEALRGKRTKSEAELIDLGANEAECEAADVLFVLLSMVAANRLSLRRILYRLDKLVSEQ